MKTNESLPASVATNKPLLNGKISAAGAKQKQIQKTVQSTQPILLKGENVSSLVNGLVDNPIKSQGSSVLSTTVRRTLDRHGIEANQEAHAKSRKNHQALTLIKKLHGNSDMDYGVFISDPKKNSYGEFDWFNPKGLKKYQIDQCMEMKFSNNKDIESLKNTYNEEPVTEFLAKLLNKETDVYAGVFKQNPKLFGYTPPVNNTSNAFLTYPNIPYMSEAYLGNHLDQLKDKKEGIQLCAWAVHPSGHSAFVDEITGKKSEKTNAQVQANESQQQMSARTGIKSLTSLLDFDQSDVEQLKTLQKGAMAHLQDTYSVDPNKDRVEMFFHFPVATKTATLHLHVWVNKGDHPLNDARAFALNDVIDHLANGKNINDMVTARNSGAFYLPEKDGLHTISGMPESHRTTTPEAFKLNL